MKKFLMTLALLLSVGVGYAQEVKFENETIHYERIVETTSLNASQLMSAIQTLNPATPKEGDDWVETINEEAKYVVLARQTEWYREATLGIMVNVIIRMKCYIKDGKAKLVANTFHEKMNIGRGNPTITPVIKETTPLASISQERRDKLSEHIKLFADRIESKIKDAEQNWNF